MTSGCRSYLEAIYNFMRRLGRSYGALNVYKYANNFSVHWSLLAPRYFSDDERCVKSQNIIMSLW